MFYAIVAYLLWGAFAAFFPLLQPAQPLEIIAHRIVWTSILMALLLSGTKGWKELRQADKRTWRTLVFAALAIALNWLTYVTIVNSGHVAEAALGYFINPLVNVLLGLVFLGEKLRLLQKLSVGIAIFAVSVLVFLSGQPPLGGLVLAASFGVYGLLKKQVQLSAETSLAAETFLLAPASLGYLIYLFSTGELTFFQHGLGHALLLICTGFITAIPMLLFNKATRLIPLGTIGMLQYLTPTMQMLWAVLIMHEQMPTIRWFGFIVIWISVAIFVWDIWLQRKPGGSGPRRPLPKA
ncbi:EamA family transporter RarD [Corynebacterium epidermidicanis]|uniref:RarD protein n=1 Tax=Corynebacterium epidermidicanis TaxID=1050174 RepID=A0A0G3GSE7_9CORY|nr:EamA family transporter RarD [Corynebacterium epidermidicanis]AKK03500.1 rarD protein [Corynebacterium epidermidicanis]